MKKLLSIYLGILFVLPTLWHPDDPLAQVRKNNHLIRSSTGQALDMDRPLDPVVAPRVSAAYDTTWLYLYTFDTPLWLPDEQGWVSVDQTAQMDVFFHVADASELDGGSYGNLFPLEGSQSLWCGVSEDVDVACDYATAPGYGNWWNQSFVSRFFKGGSIQLSYKVSWDTESGYDFVYVQYDTGDSNWVDLPVNGGVGYYDYAGTTVDTLTVTPPDSARFRFLFLSDVGWSDEDGKLDTDGAVLVDSITVVDQQGSYYEDFEDEIPGDKHTQDWSAVPEEGYGEFAGLFPGFHVLQGRCDPRMSHVWGFFSGSTYNYACGGYPEQLAVPYENARGQYITNDVCSPAIPWVGAGASLILQFDVYRDLPLDNVVFYVWRVRSIVGDCVGRWKHDKIYYWGGGKDWQTNTFEVGAFVDPAADYVQVAVGVADMCRAWCGVYGTGACHSNAPLFDNVKVARLDRTGPQWTVNDVDLFQDTFPSDGTITGTARADAADDTNLPSDPDISPRDEVVVTCASGYIPLATDPYTGFGPAAYCYVSVLPPGQPDKTGPMLEGDSFRWPWLNSFTEDGLLWNQVRMDTVFEDPIGRLGVVDDQYCVDLNDNLFTPGDTILFVFGAENSVGEWTYWSQFTGTKDDFDEVAAHPMEFQIFPGGGWLRGGWILYVDDFSGRGAQPYFETVFDKMGISDKVDRYDVRSPSSVEGNGLGGRVVDPYSQLVNCYSVIIWNSGDLSSGTIGDGTGYLGPPGPEKGDDFAVLYLFLDQHPDSVGLYISGDDVAEEWVFLTGLDAVALRSDYMDFNLTNGDHHNAGFRISPLVVGEPSSMFDHFIFGPDTLVAFGGCPGIKNFDVLEPTGYAASEATYDGTGVAANSAVISQVTGNSVLGVAKVVLSGFSYHSIRDDRVYVPSDRADHLYDIINWMGEHVMPPMKPDPGERYANRLLQNRQNPFNPSTTIEYSIEKRARVTLRIYDVTGRLVRTLVDEVQDPSGLRAVEWDGRNNHGQAVASGVYLYKMDTTNFSRTRKMVLLK